MAERCNLTPVEAPGDEITVERCARADCWHVHYHGRISPAVDTGRAAKEVGGIVARSVRATLLRDTKGA